MKFREFLNMGTSAKINSGPLDLIKMCKPVKGKGTSVSRMFNAGKAKNPAMPAKITTVNGPMTKPSIL